jgi:hypothetical protein
MRAPKKTNIRRSLAPRKLSDFSPTEFENLLFDLIIAKGMVNVVWRTPGADGGRDIEAESVQTDASNTQAFAKWYIECKKYSGSVDWPTIHPKLAYADSAGAEYLLLCTTSKFTPQAINCCNQWNQTHRYPKVRLWAGHDLSTQLGQYPDLKYRYGLTTIPATPGRSIVALSLALSKTIGSYYSASAKAKTAPDRMLRAAFAIAILLQLRMEDIANDGAINYRPLQSKDDLAIEADFTGTPQAIDEPALAAFCSYLCALTRARLMITFPKQGSYTIGGYGKFDDILNRYREAFSAIALWGNFEFTFSSSEVRVKQR